MTSLINELRNAHHLARANSQEPYRWRLTPEAWFKVRAEALASDPIELTEPQTFDALPLEIVRENGPRWYLDTRHGDGYEGGPSTSESGNT